MSDRYLTSLAQDGQITEHGAHSNQIKKNRRFTAGPIIQCVILLAGIIEDLQKKEFLTNLSITKMPIALNSGIQLFSNHKLENIRSAKMESVQKQGFKQLEILLEG